MKILVVFTSVLFLVACGAELMEFEGGYEPPEPELLGVEYAAWTSDEKPHQLRISYYLCDGGFNITEDVYTHYWSYEFEVQSSDTLVIGCISLDGGLTSVAIWVEGNMVEEEGPAFNPVITYFIP